MKLLTRPPVTVIGGGILAAWIPFWQFASTIGTIDFMNMVGGHPSIGTFFLPKGLADGVTVLGIGIIVYTFVTLKRQTNSPDAIPEEPATPIGDANSRIQDLVVTRKSVVRSDDPKITYPLKVYVEMINHTQQCAEVSISRWFSGVVAETPRGVLQIWLDYDWFPKPHGMNKIHVPGGQHIRLWIAPDKSKYTREEVQRLCDNQNLGTLMINVNGRERGILL